MLSQADRDRIAANSAAIIAATGEGITRMRLDTALTPPSFDNQFGEVTDKAEEVYHELALVGKALKLTETLAAQDFGGIIEADVSVHLPAAADVVTGDFLVVRGQWYSVGPVQLSVLGSFLACAGTRVAARTGAGLPATLNFVDDFVAGTAGDEAGELGWSGTVTEKAAEPGHPGIVTLSANDAVADLKCNSVFSTDVALLRAWVRPSIGAEKVGFRGGLLQDPSAADETSRGIYFSFASGTSPHWRAVTRDGSGAAVTTSDVACELGKWYFLEVRKKGGNYEFRVNGTVVAAQAVNVPAESVCPAFVVQSDEAAGKSLDIDYFAMAAVDAGRGA